MIKKCMLAAILMAVVMCSGVAQTTIAVLPFDNTAKNEEYAWLSDGFCESLTSGFVQIGQFIVIERKRLEDVIKEQDLQLSDLVDAARSVKVGEILGAQKVVLGSYQILGEDINVNCRIVDVQSGKVDEDGLISNKSDKIANVFRLQQDICLLLAQNMGGRISDDEIQRVSAVITNSTQSLKAVEYYQKGASALAAGKTKDAKKWYEKSKKEDPNYSAPYLGLGYAMHADGKYKDAIKHFEKCLELTPTYFQPYSMIGNCYWNLGKNDQAKEYVEKALKINPYDLVGNTVMGAIYAGESNYQKAIDCYNILLQGNPRFFTALQGPRHSLLGHGTE
jgi:tetratricopeptide (TPR) repeat protein